MKKQILILATIALPSCARVSVQKWDRNSVTVCGNKFAGQKDYEDRASEICGSSVELTGGHTATVGTMDYGNGVTGNISSNCNVYRCAR